MSRKFRVGDKVKVVGMSPVTFAPGVKDELGTEKLFKSMLGRVYTVRGFDKYGNVKLQPRRLNIVWVEAEFLTLRAGSAPRNRLCHMFGNALHVCAVKALVHSGGIPARELVRSTR
jgi:hypothetical protein